MAEPGDQNPDDDHEVGFFSAEALAGRRGVVDLGHLDREARGTHVLNPGTAAAAIWALEDLKFRRG